jgi:membrane protein YqaA with SNARE-associated domain
MAALCDQFGWPRGRTSAALCSIAFLLGTVFCTQAGLFLLDLVDHFITTYALVLVAICEAMIVGWIFPARRLREHMDEHRDFHFGQTFSVIMRVVITVVLMMSWFGLGQLDAVPLAAGIARLALLAATVILWVDQHWLDFDIRVIIPVLLLVLLDQALVREFRSAYGGYPVGAIVAVGLTWLIGTLIIGVVLDKLPTASAGSHLKPEPDPPA